MIHLGRPGSYSSTHVFIVFRSVDIIRQLFYVTINERFSKHVPINVCDLISVRGFGTLDQDHSERNR